MAHSLTLCHITHCQTHRRRVHMFFQRARVWTSHQKPKSQEALNLTLVQDCEIGWFSSLAVMMVNARPFWPL
ncbi:hypothetical protein SLEP1_g44340 [Rubroshorea leprosula]|uniref:Uncharacterized protein n=1 Tax=Rubroshorea leprosula TaxID=152421 RepID=A0AAV5LGH2_9ROSI|nr:hypothetical protein SLEP1_g44340 [Rubroshorea leprosula]